VIAVSFVIKILLSIALVTHNRPDLVERCLISLRAQKVQPYEVVVSDDSDPAYAARVRTIAADLGCTYLQGPRRGLYANRNSVALHCRGTHIRTMDDDHVLPPGHLETCVAALDVDPRSIWTTGESGFLNDQPSGVTKRAYQLGPSGFAQEVPDPDDNWAIADGSTIYPSEIFSQGFRMVEQFGFGASYLEFGALLYYHGWKSRCIHDSFVEHRAVSLSPPDLMSHRFASICFNHYFRPDRRLLLRYTLPDWRRWTRLPMLFEMARERWKAKV
jgi:glycosyltransferase involved in cell wall biosynthesis